MSLVSLNTLSVGEQAYVNKLGFGANDRRRMQDIGLIDGTRVECPVSNTHLTLPTMGQV